MRRSKLLCSIPTLGVLLLVGQLALAADATYTVTTVDVPFPGATGTLLRGIARHGLVVGFYLDENNLGHGFLYADGNFVPLDVPSGFNTNPQGVNDRGDVVGSYNEPASNRHGFIYSGGVFRTLDFPGSPPPPATELTAINNRGEVVGIYYGTADALIHSFVYADNTFTPLAVPGARLTVASGINDHGEIVGWYQDFSLRPHGFIYARGEFTTLDVPGAVGTLLLAINHGQIAGLFYSPEPAPPPLGSDHNFGHGFVYANGAFTRLDGPGAAFTEATGINPGGVIVGLYVDSTGAVHGFIRTP